jgi:formylglycine-generating enzyme required for sulfatase activity
MLIRFILLVVVLGAPLQTYAEQKYALLVGVTTYSDARMNEKPLDYPEADAMAIRDALLKSDYQVTLLVGKDATRQAIQNALVTIRQQGDRDGVLVLGFFGHGVQYGESAYFCPYDTKLREVMDKDKNILRYANGLPRQEPDPISMVSMREMLDALAGSPTGSKLLLADCCREDPNVARGGLKGRAFGSALQVNQLPKNSAALFACSEGEQAYEHKDWQHGAFTKALLTSLASGQRITANGLSESVYLGVESLVTAKGETQRVNSILSGGLVDLKLRIGSPAGPEMARSSKSSPSSPSPGSSSQPDPRTFVNSLGATFRLIPAGSFLMGSPETDTDAASYEKPQHSVTISRPYYLGETEVTQGQWKAIMGTEPWKGEIGVKEGSNYPATYVSWEDAVEYCRRLSEREGRTYRLPTESEWEYACRGGTKTRYSIGNDADELSKYGWFYDNAFSKGESYAHEVRQKLANAYGLYDMHGNVWEWCSDWNGRYSAGALTDPVGADSGSDRVSRGGGWDDRASNCRAALRSGFVPSFRGDFLGFRLLLSPSVK